MVLLFPMRAACACGADRVKPASSVACALTPYGGNATTTQCERLLGRSRTNPGALPLLDIRGSGAGEHALLIIEGERSAGGWHCGALQRPPEQFAGSGGPTRLWRGTCKVRNLASRPHRPNLQVQQNTVPNFRESAVSAASGEFCKSLWRAAPHAPAIPPGAGLQFRQYYC